MISAGRILLVAASAALAACVPALPGGTLNEPPGGTAGAPSTSGAGGTAGLPATGGAAMGGAFGPGTGGSAVTGAGGAVGPGAGGSSAVDAGTPPPRAFPFVENQHGIWNLAVSSGHVYWTNRDTSSIMKASVAGGEPVALAMSPGAPVAADATAVYWSTGADIQKVGTDGGQPTKLGSGLNGFVRDLVVSPNGVFWATDRGAVMKVGLEGGTPMVLAQKQDSATAMAVDSSYVYWLAWYNTGSAVTTRLRKVGIAGGEPVELAAWAGTSLPASSMMAVDATSVHWVDYVSGLIMKVGLEGGEPQPEIMGPAKATSVALDDTGLYWTDAAGFIYVVAPGKEIRAVAYSGLSARGIALDETHVYWISPSSIMRTPK